MATKFSKRFNVDPRRLKKDKIFNPFVDLDTRFYIHPLLLKNTQNTHFKQSYRILYNKLSVYITIIESITDFNKRDVSFREIVRRFSFDEPGGLCIGYSREGTNGSGLKGKHSLQIIESCFQVKEKGKLYPELFEILPFIEEGIGADRLSDMIANIIMEDIASFTEKMVKKYKIEETKSFYINNNKYIIPWLKENKKYILLLPYDILENLPIANSYDEIEEVVNHNRALRVVFNSIVQEAIKSKRKAGKTELKRGIKKTIIENPEILKDVVESYNNYKKMPYDFVKDELNEMRWHDDADYYFENFLKNVDIQNDSVDNFVSYILSKFKELTEINGLNRVFLSPKGTIREEIPQRIFQALSQLLIEDKNIDISPEVNLGAGEVDFKFSRGNDKVIIEMKIGSNPKVISGLTKQLTAYYDAEKPNKAYYVVIYSGIFKNKLQTLDDELLKLKKNYNIGIVAINSSKKISASKL